MLKSVAVLWGHVSVEELKSASPNLRVELPHELLQIGNVA